MLTLADERLLPLEKARRRLSGFDAFYPNDGPAFYDIGYRDHVFRRLIMEAMRDKSRQNR